MLLKYVDYKDYRDRLKTNKTMHKNVEKTFLR